MRILRSLRVTASICSMTLSSAAFLATCLSTAALFSNAAGAQEPPVPETTPPPAEQGQPAENQQPEGAPPMRSGRGRGRRQTIVIEAGTVHPVSGPAITDGVVVIRGDRIAAVGKKGEVPVPPNAAVRSFPTGHVYPGLIDAETDAFTDLNAGNSGQLDGGTKLADDLHARGDRSDALAQAGITTAYVAMRGPAMLRGQGAIVRPTHDGFQLWEGHEHAALGLRMTNGPSPSSPLQRQQELQGADGLFEGLDEYRKAGTDYEEALKKYEKEFADYLAYFEKKKGGPPAAGDNKEAPAAPAQPPGGQRPFNRDGRRGPRGGPGGGPGGGGGGGGGDPPHDAPRAADSRPSDAEVEAALATLFELIAPQDPPKQDPPKQEPAKQEPQGQPKPEGQSATPAGEKKDEAPKRPTFPKKPPPDPQKEALLHVIDGELPLRIEAHRPDELRAALRLMRERSIPLLVLEQAYGAAGLGDEMAKQGCSVVLTDLLPQDRPKQYEAFEPAALPKALHDAGVPFAIATGNARLAALLPLMAANAIGRGLTADQALRAITLTPAEILGVAKDTGSLDADKFADVLVCDGPLFASDSHVLLVLAKGRPEYEAK